MYGLAWGVSAHYVLWYMEVRVPHEIGGVFCVIAITSRVRVRLYLRY